MARAPRTTPRTPSRPALERPRIGAPRAARRVRAGEAAPIKAAPEGSEKRPRRWISAGVVAAVFVAGLALGNGAPPLAPQQAMAALTPGTGDIGPADSRGIRSVIDGLKARERALERRERSIEIRESDLRQVESQLEERLGELQALRDELQGLLDESDVVREERIKALVKMVEAMRSKQAASVFAELDDELAVDVLERMNKKKAGKALAAMDPVRAARLSEQLTESPAQELE